MILNIEISTIVMDIIHKLPSINNEDILWKLDDIQLYQKYTQHVSHAKNVKHEEKEIKKDICSKFFPTDTLDTNTAKTSVECQLKDKPEIKKVSTNSDKSNETSAQIQSIKRAKRESPMSIILKLSENNDINSAYMQQKLIEFISKKEFMKFFGVKKSSEVMSALSANKWNKSLVLFISFIFDVSFMYLNKEVQFDSEKKYNNMITI